MPIGGDDCGYELIVDLRAGEARGCVGEFSKVEGFCYPPQWRSVEAMLAEIADALEADQPVLGCERIADDGRLFWVEPSEVEFPVS
ncbi:hypothetical protein SAMN05216215_105457 [Saccharopolyspora shandongensis]|uniref:Uncharacterized protein n=1 Tax=Saccharopolyspora shandongensis TaxID=418495 RepID=A0A1H3RJC4_9PSEU|nr:hypothetical protein [Saccharopolyspora shandongensis]SDZ25703.1 hypothetical protein SAMN05216215_105457 [Saccharopolyspora shandongensis]